jgi:peptide/nickel transport system permease protein
MESRIGTTASRVGATAQWYVEAARVWVLRGPSRVGAVAQLVRRDWFFLACTGVVVGVAGAAMAAPLIAPYDPITLSANRLAGPSSEHFFGTDEFGRDVFSRVIWGARPTLLAAVAGVAIATVGGIPLGLVAGYSGRWFSGLIMRAMDILLAFPGLLLALVVVAVIGTGAIKVMIAVGVSFIPIFARVIYASTLAARREDYVAAARAVGATHLAILTRHIGRNVVAQIIVLVSSAIGWAILTAATLNFLGFGVQVPQPDWGSDLAHGKDWLGAGWWISMFPGLAITVVILASNYAGDQIGEMVDPRRRGAKARGPGTSAEIYEKQSLAEAKE